MRSPWRTFRSDAVIAARPFLSVLRIERMLAVTADHQAQVPNGRT